MSNGIITIITVVVWLSGSALVSINEVTLCRAWLVLGWVTSLGRPISVCNQPPRSTQTGHPSMGRRNEYEPMDGDALRLRSKGRYGSCVIPRAISGGFRDEVYDKELYTSTLLYITLHKLHDSVQHTQCPVSTFDIVATTDSRQQTTNTAKPKFR